MPPRVKVNDQRSGPAFSTLFFPDDRTFQGDWARADVSTLIFADSSYPPGPVAAFHGGPIASGAPVQLIFWGTFWQSNEGLARLNMIVDRMRRVVESPYFSGLAQYGIAAPSYRGAFTVTKPDAPATFGDRMEPVLDLIDDLIDDDKLPDPDDGRIVFLVFMPKAFAPPQGANGAHSADYDYDFLFDTDMYWAGWVRYFDPSLGGGDQDPESASRTAAHEIIETMTDPEGDGWFIGGDPATGEIADGAYSGPVRQTAFVNGARVQAYWSNVHNANIIPIDTDYAARITADIRLESDYEIDHGTFRPTPRPNLCSQAPACCFEDRDYRWVIRGSDEVATLSVPCQRFRTPIATWSVGGQAATGTGTLHIQTSGMAYSGRSLVNRSKTIAIDYVATATTLTLRTKRPELNFDVAVTCAVHDGSITGTLAVDVVARPAITVGFAGERLEDEAAYRSQLERCMKALTARYKENMMSDRRPPRHPVGPTEIHPEVLAALPAWTRVEVYSKGRQAVQAAHHGTELLTPEARTELRDALVTYTPELTPAMSDRPEAKETPKGEEDVHRK